MSFKECTKCGDRVEITVPPKGHSFKKETVAATCSSDGYTIYSCDCGFSYKGDVISANGHDYREITSAPTCVKGGYTLYVCNVCDDAYKDNTLSALGHELVSQSTAPDCENQGFIEYSCTRCEYSFKGDYCKPEGHSFDSKAVEPDCEHEGYTEYFCTECDYSFISDHVVPKGHDFSEKIISVADCEAQGEILYSCDCGYSYSSVTPPFGHDFNKNTVAPTVSDMGYTEFSCECGFSYKGNYRFYSDILDNAYANNDKIIAHGIDISKWNHTVDSNGDFVPLDWVALKEAGVDYVILKIGSTPRENGAFGGIEPTFEMDYEGAKAAGIDVGVYYFTYATSVSEIRKDAEVILEWLEGKTFEYPIYLDLENSPNEGYMPSEIASPILTEMCLTFFSALQREGYYTGLYVNNEFLFNILQTENMLDLFEIWYARYPSLESYDWNTEDAESFVWDTDKYGEHLGMWQFCMTGKLPPITTDVDFNYAYKDYPTLIRQNGFNGLAPDEDTDSDYVESDSIESVEADGSEIEESNSEESEKATVESEETSYEF